MTDLPRVPKGFDDLLESPIAVTLATVVPDGSIYDRIGLPYRNKITYGGREVPEADKQMLYTIRARIERFSTFVATRE